MQTQKQKINSINKLILKEIKKTFPKTKIIQEKKFKFNNKNFSFDFFVEKENKLIGFELVMRPTKGELKRKLFYSFFVNNFIFILPHQSLEFYKKKKLIGKTFTKKLFFEKEFNDDNLFVWFIDLKGNVLTKQLFKEAFNVKIKRI